MIRVSYDNFFAYLYKNNITKSALSKKSGVSRNSIIKMTKGELVHMSVIVAICEACDLDISEVVQLIRDETEE